MQEINIPKGIKKIGDYDLDEFLKTTENGVLYRVKKDGKFFTMKIIYDDKSHSILKEEQKLININCPYIIKIYQIFDDVHGQVVIMDYLDGLTLKKHIDQKKEKFLPQIEALQMFRKILIGMMELHKEKIVHRDLGTRNIIVQDNEPIIINFRSSAILKSEEQYIFDIVQGFYYDPPEILQLGPYDYQCDIWAMGVLLFKMLFGKYPFRKGKTQLDHLSKIKQCYDQDNQFDIKRAIQQTTIEKLQDLYPQTINLLKQLLELDQLLRIDYLEILEHPALQVINSKEADTQLINFYQKQMEIDLNFLGLLVDAQSEEQQVLQDAKILEKKQTIKQGDDEQATTVTAVHKLQKVFQNMKLLSQIMISNNKKFLEREINGFKEKDLDFFEMSVLRYSFMVDSFITVTCLKQIEKEMGRVETLLFKFFMCKIIVYYALMLMINFLNPQQEANQNQPEVRERIQKVGLFFHQESEKWLERLYQYQEEIEPYKMLIKNDYIVQAINIEFKVNNNQYKADPGYVPDDIIKPFRASLLMCVQHLYFTSTDINQSALFRANQIKINVQKINLVQEFQLISQNSIDEEYLNTLNEINLSGQQFIPKVNTENSTLDLQPENKKTSKTIAKETNIQETIEHISQGIGYQFIPPAIVKDILMSTKLMQIGLRLIICVSSNRIFNLRSDSLQLSHFEQAFQQTGLPNNQKKSYLFQWISGLSFLSAKSNLEFLIATHFPRLQNLEYNFLVESANINE